MSRWLPYGAVGVVIAVLSAGLVGFLLERYQIQWTWKWEPEISPTFLVAAVTALIILATTFLAYRQVRSIQQSTYSGLLVRLTEVWDSDPFVDSRHLIDQQSDNEALARRVKEADTLAQREYFVLLRPLNFFEEVSFLIEKGYIPLEDVRATFGAAMVNYYRRFSRCTEEMRKEIGNEGFCRVLERQVALLQDNEA